MRLIDADSLMETVKALENMDGDYADSFTNMAGNRSIELIRLEDYIENAPTVDADPVVHAHWIPEYPNKRTGKAYSHKCSVCRKTVYNNRQVSVDELGYVFCPNCGAKMDKKIVSDEDEAK